LKSDLVLDLNAKNHAGKTAYQTAREKNASLIFSEASVHHRTHCRPQLPPDDVVEDINDEPQEASEDANKGFMSGAKNMLSGGLKNLKGSFGKIGNIMGGSSGSLFKSKKRQLAKSRSTNDVPHHEGDGVEGDDDSNNNGALENSNATATSPPSKRGPPRRIQLKNYIRGLNFHRQMPKRGNEAALETSEVGADEHRECEEAAHVAFLEPHTGGTKVAVAG
jgi:hypothetical protein